jgi:hypothetical protein
MRFTERPMAIIIELTVTGADGVPQLLPRKTLTAVTFKQAILGNAHLNIKKMYTLMNMCM